MLVPNPGFLTFSKHILALSHKRVSESEADALRSYFCNTSGVVDQRVYKLIIESCHMTDATFAKILDGLFG